MRDGPLPTFILVGAMKCGTTSLHQYLEAHPEICVSDPKEPNFFLGRNEKGLDWYRQCFDGEAREYGEASTNYTKYPTFRGVPERMHDLLPEVKLLYLVRDPIERALSHYAHNRAAGREAQSVDEAFRPVEESHYLQTSRYHAQISRYLDHYPREHLLVVESERLRADRRAVLRTIFEFLGVATEIDGTAFEEEYHTTSGKLRPGVSSFLQETALGRMLTSVGRAVLPQALLERGLDVVRSDVERPTLSDTTRHRVRAYLQDDADRLRALTGMAFDSWSL
jgi:hypothetical protein